MDVSQTLGEYKFGCFPSKNIAMNSRVRFPLVLGSSRCGRWNRNTDRGSAGFPLLAPSFFGFDEATGGLLPSSPPAPYWDLGSPLLSSPLLSSPPLPCRDLTSVSPTQPSLHYGSAGSESSHVHSAGATSPAAARPDPR
jgi:hypothetical protein